MQINKLNQQIFFMWMKILKQRPSQNLNKKANILNSGEFYWKNYAMKIETEMKEIQKFRMKTQLDSDLSKKLNLASFESNIN